MTDCNTTSGVTQHPLLLTSLVLYSIVLGLPLSKFPPIDVPRQSDLFLASVVLLLLVRMALTFYYGVVADKYPGKLFVLELSIAGITAWQFRVLLDDRVDDSGSRLWLFYVLHLAFVATMVVWSRLLGPPRGTPPLMVLVLRWIGVIAAIAGLAHELPVVSTESRMKGRWIVATVLLTLAAVYAFGKPWRRFETAAQQPSSPVGSHDAAS